MNFEDLNIWQRATKLCAEIYKSMLKQHDYGFKDQITRSALSIASNIAEGYERDSDKDRVKFLSYAKASTAELRTQIYIGIEINYIDKQQGLGWIDETQQLSKMIYGLMKKIAPPHQAQG